MIVDRQLDAASGMIQGADDRCKVPQLGRRVAVRGADLPVAGQQRIGDDLASTATLPSASSTILRFSSSRPRSRSDLAEATTANRLRRSGTQARSGSGGF